MHVRRLHDNLCTRRAALNMNDELWLPLHDPCLCHKSNESRDAANARSDESTSHATSVSILRLVRSWLEDVSRRVWRGACHSSSPLDAGTRKETSLGGTQLALGLGFTGHQARLRKTPAKQVWKTG